MSDDLQVVVQAVSEMLRTLGIGEVKYNQQKSQFDALIQDRLTTPVEAWAEKVRTLSANLAQRAEELARTNAALSELRQQLSEFYSGEQADRYAQLSYKDMESAFRYMELAQRYKIIAEPPAQKTKD
jgi:predicted nuclease with TOPRIM domain